MSDETSMANSARASDRRGILGFSLLAGIIGGLCCLTPIVLVLAGAASVAVAADLGNVLYGDYRWAFRAAALVFILLALVVYFRRRGICTLQQARRERNRILNMSLLVLLAGAGVYLLWTYVVLHYWGIAVGLPWAQYSDESWALSAAAVLLVLFFIGFRRFK
jgi:cation transport ATPase